MHGVIGWIKDALPASLGVTATAAAGAAVAAPGWLIALGQAAVVVVFTVKAIDKRLARLHERQNTVEGKVETVLGRIDGLSCQSPRKTPAPLARCGGCKDD